MLSVSDLTVRYGMHEALSSISVQISRDEIVVILGANGAGKSTLLSAIAGTSVGEIDGLIQLDGEPLLGLDAAQTVERGIAYVPEGRGVFADLSVEENLQLGSYTEHARGYEHDSLRKVLALFPKLEERRKQIVRTMSGGEQQMVAIGRALMSSPTILMLDEPSLGLSPLLCKELFTALKQVRDSGVGILLVEQNAKQSLSISDRGYLLGNGKIIGHDEAKNLLNDPTVQAAYLGGAMATHKPQKNTLAMPEAVNNDQSGSNEQSGLFITPNAGQQKSPALSSDSLLDEGIDSLVARASSSATEFRDVDSALPVQVVKLSNHGTSPVSTGSANAATSINRSGNTINKTVLPETQDTQVQAMLAEFEAAAKNAVSSSSTRTSLSDSTTAVSNSVEDDLPLPHIPVFKKSVVTVYRRDGSGKLRKQH